MSGKHCVLMRQKRTRHSSRSSLGEHSVDLTKQVWLVDHSSNGTFLNGRRLEKGAMFELHHRDEVSLVVQSSHEAMKSFKNGTPTSHPHARAACWLTTHVSTRSFHCVRV